MRTDTIPNQTMKLLPPSIVLAALSLVACGGGEPPSEPPSGAQLLPESFWRAAPPEPALDVLSLRGLEDGAQVVVRGEVQDFVGGLASLKLADHSLTSCAEMEGEDHCKTPWDFCCEDPEALRRGLATVEFREGGQPLARAVRGFHGIEHLTDVVVAGVLHVDEQGNLLVVAESISAE